MFKYALIGSMALSLTLAGTVMWLQHSNTSLKIENSSLTRSVTAFKMQAAQAQLARDVEAARAEQSAKRAAELDASIESLLTGDIPDVPLDPRIIAFLNSIGLHRPD